MAATAACCKHLQSHSTDDDDDGRQVPFKRVIGLANKSKLIDCDNNQRRPKMSVRRDETRRMAILCAHLTLTILATATTINCAHQHASTSTTTSKSGAAVTPAHSEAIKWSFGGWAPLNGASNATSTTPGVASGAPTATSPLPQTTNRTARGFERQRGSEALSESASNSHDRIQFAAPPQRAGSSRPEQNHAQHHRNEQHARHAHHHHQVAPYHHEAAAGVAPPSAFAHASARPQPPAKMPASLMMMQQAQSSQVASHFSPPAPLPIVREQLLPVANTRHQQPQPAAQVAYPPPGMHMAMHMGQSGPQQQHHHRPQMMPHHPNQQARRPHHHFNNGPPPPPPPHIVGPLMSQRRPPHEHYAREMEHRHKQQMMRHHQRHHQMMMQQQQQQQQHHMHQMQHAHPGEQHHRPQQQPRPAIVMHHQQHGPVPKLSAFKVIEGEQPILFNAPPQMQQSHEDNSVRMIEMGGQGHHMQQQQQAEGAYQNMSATNFAAPASSAMNAIEKDNLNYQQAMQQVSKSLAEEEQRQQHEQQQQQATRQSNNIQEVKQRQLYHDQQQQQQKEEAAGGAASKAPYLTIPVAVETDGDKVLTPDDINEIEKHVINVLPNLKTADKIVKIADAQLNLTNIKGAVQQVQEATAAAAAAAASAADQRQPPAASGGPEMSQQNYEEHKSTMRQLAGQHHNEAPVANNYARPASQQATSTSSTGASQTAAHHASTSQPAGVSQASTANAHHQAAPEVGSAQQQQQQQEQLAGGLVEEQQYFVATGPAQELGTVDADQVAEYNLIKNDLLNKFHYEPTRARNQQQQQQHTSSTPPMPHTTTSHHQHQQQQPTRPMVSRYFHQQPGRQAGPMNSAQRQQDQRDNLFGRLRQPTQANYQQQQQATSSTRTMMGGRKVSDVMRPLIRTTPIPMTTPLHVPSVEPEKVDAIQFIAGQAANDKQPVVVEAHQLVSHTPDGGIDYSTGQAGMQQQQVQQQQGNQSYHEVSEQQMQQQQQFVPQANPNEEGAIIEYVSISDQALNNALAQQQHSTTPGQQQQQQAYELASTPELQPVYMSAEGQQQQQSQAPEQQQQRGQQANQQAPLLYAYSMPEQQQHEAGHSTTRQLQQPASTPSYLLTSVTTEQPQVLLVEQQREQHQQQEGVAQPSLAWSPSVASEHEQQQREQQHMELVNQAGPLQQMDLPATAGYNLFGGAQSEQQQAQQVTQASGQEYEQQPQPQQQQQQQEQELEQEHHSRWRTRAGGRQPNPDAQYDGQIVRDSSAQGQTNNEETATSPSNAGEEEQKGGEHQQQQAVEQHYSNGNFNQSPQSQQQQHSVDELGRLGGHQDEQQQQQQLEQGTSSYEQQPTTQAMSQPGGTRDQYDQASMSAFHGSMGGAQLNHNHNQGAYARPQQSQQQTGAAYGQSAASTPMEQQAVTTSGHAYAKLDRERQQSHLAEQQAQHQAQLAELMGGQQQQQQQESGEQQQQQYQTTSTPLTLTTMAAAIEQQAERQQQQRYETEQAREPSSGQVPESSQALLINPDAPIQMPIMDQQSLINEQEVAAGGQQDDGEEGKARQPAAVYQVYQAYYAPKDHKPLPGYVRLSLEEFNELFKDAEIQFVDKNLNGLAKNLVNQQQQQQQDNSIGPMNNNNNENLASYDHMKASASEHQAIVVDRRSMPTTNATSQAIRSTVAPSGGGEGAANLKLGQASVKKIISIRNSRQAAKRAESQEGQPKGAKGFVMKRVKAVATPLQANKPNANVKSGSISTTTTSGTTTTTVASTTSLRATEPPFKVKKAPIYKATRRQEAKESAAAIKTRQRDSKRLAATKS